MYKPLHEMFISTWNVIYRGKSVLTFIQKVTKIPNTVLFKYYYITKFVSYATTNLARAEIYCQNYEVFISKLLIVSANCLLVFLIWNIESAVTFAILER